MIFNIIISIVSGIIATAGMTLFMNYISKTGFANANMVRAIGTIFTKNLDEGYNLGLTLHFIAGILIAFVYISLISLYGPTNIYGYAGFGTLIGLFHGFAFSFILIIAVAEHHPLEKFKQAGFEVALAHLAGHVVYGLIIGIVTGIFNLNFS